MLSTVKLPEQPADEPSGIENCHWIPVRFPTATAAVGMPVTEGVDANETFVVADVTTN